MYPAIKFNAISEEDAIKICGKELVERVKSINCEFTNRVIDECEEVTEMSASVDFGDGSLTILYLISNDDIEEHEDAGDYDYSNYTFVIE
jgi:hypothetical protein